LTKARIDTQSIGLDTSLALSRWLTGGEHLHYGLWTGLDVCAANVVRAQVAYFAKWLRWSLQKALQMRVAAPRRQRLAVRLFETARNAAVFTKNNRYIFLRLGQTQSPQ
jgi:hypothetical protein